MMTLFTFDRAPEFAHGFVRVCDVHDPNGNRLSFVQVVA